MKTSHTLLVAGLWMAWAPPLQAEIQDPHLEAITDAYAYLLGRALVIRQEQLDLAGDGAAYNRVVHHPVGAEARPDVARLEAWIAVDEQTAVILEVPRIGNRYYTVQICNEWGEVITNINPRTWPYRPSGKFALVSPRSRAELPAGAAPIVLHSHKAKLVAQVAVAGDAEGAAELQRKFTLTPSREPRIDAPVSIPEFDAESLPGVELFDAADAILASALDVSPAAPAVQSKVRWVAQLGSDPMNRRTLHTKIVDKVIPRLRAHAASDAAQSQNHWRRPRAAGSYGADVRARTCAHLDGIWTNTMAEVVTFVGARDAAGEPLDGSRAYVLHFPAGLRPDRVAKGYWSLTLTDAATGRAVANPLERFHFDSRSRLAREGDGSLKILVGAEHDQSVPDSNWLPAPAGRAFELTLRAFAPRAVVVDGGWFPPALERVE